MEINFIRRYYYNLFTGKILASVYREGDIIYTPPEDDFAEQEALQGRSLADVGMLEWFEKDAEIEAALATMQASVDVTADPPELIFTPREHKAQANVSEVV